MDAVPILPAVSILAVRDGGEGIEIFVQQRQRTMDFAAGVVAYPGGRVDPIDVERADPHSPCAQAHAELWGDAPMLSFGPGGALCDAVAGLPASAPAAALIAAAQRELAEETGAHVAPDALIPWDVWTTPPGYAKRFDTYFYALNAADLHLENQTTEAAVGRWVTTSALLASFLRGEVELWRPTYTLLRSIDALPAAAAAAHGPGRTIVPDRPADQRSDAAHHAWAHTLTHPTSAQPAEPESSSRKVSRHHP